MNTEKTEKVEPESPPRQAMVTSTSWQWPGSWRPSDTSNGKLPLLPTGNPHLSDLVYPMTLKPRGLCIIINNVDFGTRFPKRHGSEVDVRLMEDLFEALFFSVQMHRDLTGDGMKSLLSEVAKEEKQKNAQCLVVILMSHGENGAIYGIDGKLLNLKQEVYAPFNDSNCPSLQGKPKVFFVQACRRGEGDSAIIEVRGAPNSSLRRKYSSNIDYETGSGDWTTTVSEMHVAESTRPELVAHRDTGFGSWFLSAVYKVLSCHSWELPLEQLMERVKEEVEQQTSYGNRKQTPVFTKVRVTKKLYFNPGFRENPLCQRACRPSV